MTKNKQPYTAPECAAVQIKMQGMLAASIRNLTDAVDETYDGGGEDW